MLKLVSVLRAANRRIRDPRYYDRLTILQDFETTLIVPYQGDAADNPLAKDEKFRGMDMRFLPVRMPRLAGWGDGLHTVSGLKQVLSELKPDVIHVNEEPLSLLAYQAGRLRDQVAENAALVLESDQSGTQAPPAALRLSERATLGRADGLVVRNRAALDARRMRGFNALGAIIEHAVDLDVFHPGTRDAARERLGADGLTLGYVGPLIAGGGLIEVLEAMAACRAKLHLLVMGRGDLRNELADRAMVLKIQDRVQFFEPRSGDDLPFFLSALDILVATTRPAPGLRDPFDRTVAEAQSCGIPVIASDEGALPEMVGDGGWTVDAGDAGMLAQLFTRIAQDPVMLRRAAFHASRQASARFDMRHCAAELQRVFISAHERRVTKPSLAPVAQSALVSPGQQSANHVLARRVEP